MNQKPSLSWVWISAGVLAVDRATKFAIERFTPDHFRRPIISDVVTLVHHKNPGIAFGIFSDFRSPWLPYLLLLSSAVIATVLAWLLWSDRAGGRSARVGIALILGGAVGNSIDRLLHGGVTDFLEVRLGTFYWPAFNIADSTISIGAALILFDLVFGPRDETSPGQENRS